MSKATRLAHRLAREDTLKGRSTMEGHVLKTPKPYASEEITAGATIVAAMLQTGKLPVPDLGSDFAIPEASKTARRAKMTQPDLQPDALGVSDNGAKAFDNLFAKPMSNFRRAPVCRAV